MRFGVFLGLLGLGLGLGMSTGIEMMGLLRMPEFCIPTAQACTGEAAAFTLQNRVRLETRAQDGARLWSHGPEMKLLKGRKYSS